MKIRELAQKLALQEDLNFLLSNRIPRLAATHFMGWFSQIRQPWVCSASIAAWKVFSDLDLSEARKQKFDSLHDCFVRELVAGARTPDPDPNILVSPCDGIVGACGQVEGGNVFQAKGFPYSLNDLFGNEHAARPWHDGVYVTVRITSAMYHRFHAPYRGTMRQVRYIAGDTWNVNPIALKRVEKLFCKNERAVLSLEIGAQRYPVALVPVAAILVGGIRLHGLDTLFHTRYGGPTDFSCTVDFDKGDELGWFQHGSTILLFAPRGFRLADQIALGARVKAGQILMRLPG